MPRPITVHARNLGLAFCLRWCMHRLSVYERRCNIVLFLHIQVWPTSYRNWWTKLPYYKPQKLYSIILHFNYVDFKSLVYSILYVNVLKSHRGYVEPNRNVFLSKQMHNSGIAQQQNDRLFIIIIINLIRTNAAWTIKYMKKHTQ